MISETFQATWRQIILDADVLLDHSFILFSLLLFIAYSMHCKAIYLFSCVFVCVCVCGCGCCCLSWTGHCY